LVTITLVLVAATYNTIINNQSWETHQFGGRVQHLEKLSETSRNSWKQLFKN